MKTLLDELQTTLQQDERLVIDGKLAKNKVVELALKLDKDLLKLLLTNEKLKERFFKDIDGISVFDKQFFQRFITNKQFLPDSYTVFKNRIGLTDNGEDYLKEKNDVSLIWPYKDCVLEGGQTKEDAKRDEVFWNEILAPDHIDRLLDPKVLSNFKKYERKNEGQVKNLSLNENFIIKGNNLLALKSLENIFSGKAKMIYIDPPYNTESDSFNYNDKFSHSTWLTFMKNRIEIAKKLLRKDGFFCCHIDNNEGEYLKVLLDEIFGRENYLTTFYIRVRYPDKTLKQDMDFHKEIETIHIYRNSINSKPNRIEEEKTLDKYIYYFEELGESKEVQLGGKKVEIFKKDDIKIKKGKPSKSGRKEIWASGSILDGNSSGRFFRDHLMGRYKTDGYGVVYKVYGVGDEQNNYRYFTGPNKKGATKGKYYQGVPSSQANGDNINYLPISNFYDLAGSFGNCRSEGGVELRSGKKPEKLLKILLHHFSDQGDLVIDFHLGSGTTCAVAHKMGRKFIGVEQLDYGENDSVKRLKNVINGDKTGISKDEDIQWEGGGDFVYCELTKFNSIFVDQIEKTDSKGDLQKIWEKMQESAFLSYKIVPSEINNEKKAFDQLTIEEQKRFLIEILDKNQLYVNYSEIDDKEFNVSEDDKKLNHQFYSLKKK